MHQKLFGGPVGRTCPLTGLIGAPERDEVGNWKDEKLEKIRKEEEEKKESWQAENRRRRIASPPPLGPLLRVIFNSRRLCAKICRRRRHHHHHYQRQLQHQQPCISDDMTEYQRRHVERKWRHVYRTTTRQLEP